MLNKIRPSIRRNIIKEPYITVITLSFLMFILLIGVEFINRGTCDNVIDWIVTSRNAAFMNYVILCLAFLVIFSLIGRFNLAIVLTALPLLFLSLVSHYKLHFLGQNLYPWDFLSFTQVLTILPHLLKGVETISMLKMLFVLLLLVLTYYFTPSLSFKPRWRVISFTLSLLVLFSISNYRGTLVEDLLEAAQLENVFWVQNENYKRNGFLLSFLLNLDNAFIDPPSNYSKEDVEALINRIEMENKSNSMGNKQEVKPDIIMVATEAFWDPSVLSIKYSSDPLPTYRSLLWESTNGRLFSPVFGGMTANTGFEVLTGFSTKFLPEGSVPYQQYIKKPFPALPRFLEQKGYRAVAIHPYDSSFYERNKVFPLLGFQDFVSKEDLIKPQYKGYYISDAEVAKQIIKQTEISQTPSFIYAVTMQNHGPYNDNRYKSKTKIKVQSKLSDSSTRILETYLQGINDSDNALKVLVEHYKRSKRPTVIVFFGDHLPFLGKDYQVYTETGFLKSVKEDEWSYEERLKMRSVPLLFWSNYNNPKKDIDNLSASFLGPYLFDFIGFEKPAYYSYLASLYESMPVFSSSIEVDSKKSLYRDTPARFKDEEHQYWLLQYDFMFGEAYSKNFFFNSDNK